MRMNARRGEELPRMRIGERDGLAGTVPAGPRHNHLDDADSRRTSHYGVAVAVITIVGEVDADIYKQGGGRG